MRGCAHNDASLEPSIADRDFRSNRMRGLIRRVYAAIGIIASKHGYSLTSVDRADADGEPDPEQPCRAG